MKKNNSIISKIIYTIFIISFTSCSAINNGFNPEFNLKSAENYFPAFEAIKELSLIRSNLKPPVCEEKLENKKSKIRYIGETDRSFVECIISNSDKKNVELVITSNGGDTAYGLLGGFIIKKLNWDISIIGPCLSSCGNYIIPAAKKLVIEPFSFIGLHGAPNQKTIEIAKQELENITNSNKKNGILNKDQFLNSGIEQATREVSLNKTFAAKLNINYGWFELSNPDTTKAIGNGENYFLLADRNMLKACLPNVGIKKFWEATNQREISKIADFANMLQVTFVKNSELINYNCM